MSLVSLLSSLTISQWALVPLQVLSFSLCSSPVLPSFLGAVGSSARIVLPTNQQRKNGQRILPRGRSFSLSLSDSLLEASQTESQPLRSLMDSFVVLVYDPLPRSSSFDMRCELLPIILNPLGHVNIAALLDNHNYTWHEHNQQIIRLSGRLAHDEQDYCAVHVHISCSHTIDVTARVRHLIAILSRVMLQRILLALNHSKIQTVFFYAPTDASVTTSTTYPLVYTWPQLKQKAYTQLFTSLLDPSTTNIMDRIEMSNMVDASGRHMACIPRSLIHTFNILHDGIGVLVWRPSANHTPSQTQNKQTPHSYHH